MGTDPQLLIQDVRSQLSDAQRLDECSERGWMLAPARVVQEEARERRAPIFQHPDQGSVREMGAACACDMNARPTPSIAARVRRPMSFVISGPLTATATD